MLRKQDSSYSRGVWAEDEAARYLCGQGFSMLKKRYKTKFGEIDLITQKDNLICFVEVKIRQSEAEALESITLRSRKRIENSALFFLSENPEFMSYDMRFDVIAVFKSGNSCDIDDFEITHLDNAWEAGA